MDYVQSMIRLCFVVDQIALLIIAHMYNIHIGVILSKKFWCTHANQNIENFFIKSDIILAYIGCMKFEETRHQIITSENVDMSKLLFNFKPECNQKANETHTQSSAEIEDVTPKPPPSPSVSPQKCVPSSPAAGQNEENQVVPPDDPPKSESPLVPPQKLAPGSPADEIEEKQAVEPLVSPPVLPQNWHQVLLQMKLKKTKL